MPPTFVPSPAYFYPLLPTETLKPSSAPSRTMKDRPRSSVYVPPHLRRLAGLSSDARSSPLTCLNNMNKSLAHSHLSSDDELPDGKPESAYSTYNFSSANENEWKQKLEMFVRDKKKQELISREKKDRRDFEQIAALAGKMGLYSHLYAKVAVFSKVPLPNYRFDLDDKRPLREVELNAGLLRSVDAYLEDYLSCKSRSSWSVDSCSISSVSSSRSSSYGSLATDDGLLDQSVPQASSMLLGEKLLCRRSLQLCDQQQAWQESPEGQRMLEFRRSLPAFKERDAILAAIARNQVVLISGETGCGKTTQIPQFILESEVSSLRGAACSIICTQPRRISAISVSERVASERGEKLGSSVGYKVRLEGMKGRDTHLLFCTTGILLRRLLVDRNLRGVSHVVVDEIHERGINEDFLLIILKDLLPRRPDLRLILMSATLDAELFSLYFGGAPVISIPGFTYPVQIHFLENILEKTGYVLTPHNQIDDYGQERMWKMNRQILRKRKSQIASAVEVALKAADFENFSHHTRESLFCWNPDCIGFNLIEHLLSYICENGRPGAILVFLTGWDEIVSLKDKLLAHPILGDPGQVLLLACHGSMASSEQREIFEEPENGVRKVVLATNIAETSITINDVVFVVDCGKAKETSYDALNNAPCLLPSWIAKVSAQQRRGRAGRVQPGECYRLYPHCVYDTFAEYQLPEILRTPLQSLCLQIKRLRLGSISEFLSRALQSPELLAVEKAIEYLKVIGALDDNENLTILGHYLTMLPMEPKFGKMLILGAILNCLDPILTIVAGASVRDPFMIPVDKKDLAEAAKSRFSHSYSDHLAIVRCYDGWIEAEKDYAGYEYCWNNFLSLQSMKALDSLRDEFKSLLEETGLIDGNTANCNLWSYDEHLIRAVICYGLYPGVCSVVYNERSFSLKTMEDGQVFIHSNSANARESKIPYPWLVFNEKIKVNSVLLRDTTAVSDSVLLLFGGNISAGDMDGHLKMLGGYLEFFMKTEVAEMFQCLRREFDELIETKLLNPKMSVHAHHELISAIRLLISEDQCSGQFVLARHLLKPLNVRKQPCLVLSSGSGPGGDNSKSQLQTLLTRAGYAAPTYRTQQLQNNQFQAEVAFNGHQIVGRPCNNKKSAEKDAASVALQWLMGSAQAGREYLNHVTTLLKRSKRDHSATTA